MSTKSSWVKYLLLELDKLQPEQAALAAGLPTKVQCMTINKVCGSGLKSVMLASDMVSLGHSEIAIAGGQESMSLAPHLLEKSRGGYRLGNFQVHDSMLRDGLWDPYNDFHMGNAAEKCVKEKSVSREQQDEFAKQSYEFAQKAQKDGLFANEISPVEVKARKETLRIDTDEEPGKARFDKMAKLRPAFEKDGSITAANASKINDGAAALVVASAAAAKRHGMKPMAKVVASATFAQEPVWFTTAPSGAIERVLKKANLKMEEIDLWEINEAFSVVTMSAMMDFNIPREKVNVHGGAVALGHPIGASGARLMTTLLHALKTREKKYGLTTLCLGGGEAVAMIVERI